jgi:uracil-DNA glycosylase
MTVKIQASWYQALQTEFEKEYWTELTHFVRDQYQCVSCFPLPKHIFRAFDMTPLPDVKVVILGQDPYHTPGAAMGLSFSVPNGSKSQPSLSNIFKELADDLGIQRTQTDLSDWAEQGVLLLNSVLTVQSGLAASHSKKGWEVFTDAVIRTISEKNSGVVFILWGNYAASKKVLINTEKHCIISSPHPSPFSAYSGFFGSHPFSKTNTYLVSQGKSPIDWGALHS